MSTDIFIDENIIQSDNLEGQLGNGSVESERKLSEDYYQLDEPILDTLMRDLKGIYNKMKIVALPLSSYDTNKTVLRGWDLWGPLLLCTFLAFQLYHSDNHPGPQFADMFVLVWFGSCIVSINYRLLSLSSINNQMISKHGFTSSNRDIDASRNDEHNISEAVRVGDDASRLTASIAERPHQILLNPPSTFQLMCVFGYCLIAPCIGILILKFFDFQNLLFERAIVGLLFGFVWPTFCSIKILIRYQHPNKRALTIYPIGLFYFVLSCMIILAH